MHYFNELVFLNPFSAHWKYCSAAFFFLVSDLVSGLTLDPFHSEMLLQQSRLAVKLPSYIHCIVKSGAGQCSTPGGKNSLYYIGQLCMLKVDLQSRTKLWRHSFSGCAGSHQSMCCKLGLANPAKWAGNGNRVPETVYVSNKSFTEAPETPYLLEMSSFKIRPVPPELSVQIFNSSERLNVRERLVWDIRFDALLFFFFSQDGTSTVYHMSSEYLRMCTKVLNIWRITSTGCTGDLCLCHGKNKGIYRIRH